MGQGIQEWTIKKSPWLILGHSQRYVFIVVFPVGVQRVQLM